MSDTSIFDKFVPYYELIDKIINLPLCMTHKENKEIYDYIISQEKIQTEEDRESIMVIKLLMDVVKNNKLLFNCYNRYNIELMVNKHNYKTYFFNPEQEYSDADIRHKNSIINIKLYMIVLKQKYVIDNNLNKDYVKLLDEEYKKLSKEYQ